MVPQGELNRCMRRIIHELLNINTKFDKLTDYIVNNYIDDARFPFYMWNYFDSLGQRARMNDHLEGYIIDNSMQAYQRIQIFGHTLMKYVHRKSLFYVA